MANVVRRSDHCDLRESSVSEIPEGCPGRGAQYALHHHVPLTFGNYHRGEMAVRVR